MRFVLLISVVTWHVISFDAIKIDENHHESGERTNALELIIRTTNTFAPNFYKNVANTKPADFVCMPMGILMIQSMKHSSATLDLLWNNHALPEIGFQALVDKMTSFKPELRFFNETFLTNNFKPESKAATLLVDYSGGKNHVSARLKAATRSINEWFKIQTKNIMKDAIKTDDLSSETTQVSVNGVYFKAHWALPFYSEDTKSRFFFVNDYKLQEAPTMYIDGVFRSAVLPEIKARFIQFPFKDSGSKNVNDSMSMFAIYPDEVNGLRELEKNIEKIKIDKLFDGSGHKSKIYLPKFKIETSIELNQPLASMSLVDIFINGANVNGNAENPRLSDNKITQKVFIEVNEKGVVVAAISWDATPRRIELLTNSPSVNFRTHKPAIIVIASKSVPVPLFVARYTEPEPKIVGKKIELPYIFHV